MDAIIDRAGLTKGSFFYHFDTKDDLARAIVRRYAELDAELLRWRRLLGEKLRAAMEDHEPRRPVDADDLADMLLVAFEGGLVVSETLREPDTVARQLALYRTFLETLFPEG